MKLAIVHDYLNQYGGAEKTLEALHEAFPGAPVFTSIFLPENLPAHFSAWNIRSSFMQKLPFLKRHFKKYLLFYPKAIESFDLSEFDVVLSSSSAFAKGARVSPKACHICYCYSPMRFVWTQKAYFERERINRMFYMFLPFVLSWLKKWDLKTAVNVHHYIAISRFIQERIKTCFQRDSDVIYPPVDVSGFSISESVGDYFLVVSRLNAYKKIDIVVQAFNQLSRPLVVVGVGPEEKILRKQSKKNIVFLGRLSQTDLGKYLSQCRGFVFPGEEDFGIAPVEAMACGRPVIAYKSGGALETVKEGATGVFFDEPNCESLIEAVHRFEKLQFDPIGIRQHAMQFDKEVFKNKIKEYVLRRAKCKEQREN